MTKYKLILALSIGVCFASCLGLLLNVKSTLLTLAVSLLLAPGSMLASLLSGSWTEISDPVGILAGSTVLYGAVAYGLISHKFGSATRSKMRLTTIRVAASAFALMLLASIPALNPLWPRGMKELARQEKSLQEGLPVGMALEPARAFLRSRGIQFYENTEEKQGIILDNTKGVTVTASPDDQIISARFQTEASQFPCGYDMQIVLLFGRDDRLKQQYIHRFRVCP